MVVVSETSVVDVRVVQLVVMTFVVVEVVVVLNTPDGVMYKMLDAKSPPGPAVIVTT